MKSLAGLAPPRLALHEICKAYPGVLANDRVSLDVAPGEIHAVLGENGAGKSTLMKIVYGAIQPDAGRIELDGRAVSVRSPSDARAQGVAMVFQHLSLFESLSVAENVWLGLDRAISLEAVRQQIHERAQAYGLSLDTERPVHALSIGERQRVEIVRALLARPRLLILDEPTSVLTPQAVEGLFKTLRQLSAEGCAILYISHKLDEIRQLCHRCTVLRQGRVTGTVNPAQESNASLSRLMIGEDPAPLQHRPLQRGDLALSLHGLDLPPLALHGVALHHLNLDLHGGEILGVAGVSGSGQQALLAVLSGEDRRAAAGSVQLHGADIAQAGPAERRALGLRIVPEERLGRGAVPSLSLATNTLLTRTEGLRRLGWINRAATRQLAQRLIDQFQVKCAGPEAPAQSLSGGNLQKYIVGRELDARPQVLVVAQPTWGVDVGAAALIRRQMLALRDQGSAVLLISEDLDELFELSDRLVVMSAGRLSPSVDRRDATVAQIGEWMGASHGTA